MTKQDAINSLRLFPQWNKGDRWLTIDGMRELSDMAVEALEKQIPKKIDFEINFGDHESRFACSCGKRFLCAMTVALWITTMRRIIVLIAVKRWTGVIKWK